MQNGARLCGMLASELIGNQPFEVAVEIMYYDGPVSGIVRCQGNEGFYRFEMLDWDRKQQTRIFGLTMLHSEIATTCIQLDTATSKPTASLLQERPVDDQKLSEILRPFDRIEFVVAWDNRDVTVLAVKDVQSLAMRLPDQVFFERPAEETDWFALLNLARE